MTRSEVRRVDHLGGVILLHEIRTGRMGCGGRSSLLHDPLLAFTAWTPGLRTSALCSRANTTPALFVEHSCTVTTLVQTFELEGEKQIVRVADLAVETSGSTKLTLQHMSLIVAINIREIGKKPVLVGFLKILKTIKMYLVKKMSPTSHSHQKCAAVTTGHQVVTHNDEALSNLAHIVHALHITVHLKVVHQQIYSRLTIETSQ
mmetsp:Transcript_587/g.1750  ORF Transcript_587/g.1750 Transcript_587/m.1750 type:complete len:204 (+) Transcript_587:72-683(+)